MRQLYPDAGLVEQLRRIATGGLRFHLFVNNYTPALDANFGSIVEASFTGYAPVDLDETDFTASGVTGHVGFMLAAPISFLNSSGAPVDAYGYYVSDTGDAQFLAIARFDLAPITKADGESFIVVPTWADFSAFTEP
jgi:hypothetical protein